MDLTALQKAEKKLQKAIQAHRENPSRKTLIAVGASRKAVDAEYMAAINLLSLEMPDDQLIKGLAENANSQKTNESPE